MTVTQAGLIKTLLEAGVHFGHQTKHWNPKMAPYIFGEKNGIYIVNLQLTANAIAEACEFLKRTAAAGGYILFVGTKKQAQEIIRAEAERCGMFWVNQRWLGGCLTNFQTVKKGVKRLNELERMKTDGTFERLSKKEVSQLSKEMFKLKKNLEGIREMEHIPQALLVIDSKKEQIAVREANKLDIPVVAVVDTNCDPEHINYIIPGNDDAIKSIKLVSSLLAEAVKEGRDQFLAGKEREKEAAAEEAALRAAAEVSDEEVEQLITKEDVRLEEEAKKEEEKPIGRKKPPVKKKRKTE